MNKHAKKCDSYTSQPHLHVIHFFKLQNSKKKFGFPGEAFTAETEKSNFRIEYLREFEIKFENTVACESGA